MLEELKAIDQSAIKELSSIKTEQETVQKRLEKMEAKRESVSEEVYDRVHVDYTGRYEELEDTARPLKESAKSEYVKLSALLERMAANFEEVRLAKEELTFRHELGEFDEKEFKDQIEESEKKLKECDAELKQGEVLKGKFVAAFHSEDELEGQAAAEPPPPPPPVEEEVIESDEQPAEVDATAELEPVQPEAAEPPAPPPERGSDATALLTMPSFVYREDDGTEQEYPLALGTTTIGRLNTNDICVPLDVVSRHHARVEMAEEGFMIIDQDSENGIYINGERVKQHLLVDGDKVELGPGTREFEFRFTEPG
jgi:hypothetical protein